jgi:hypothetical protein
LTCSVTRWDAGRWNCPADGEPTAGAVSGSSRQSSGSRSPREVDIWLERFRRFWSQRLDALATELARGKRERREQRGNTAGTPSCGTTDGSESEEDT